MWIMYSLLPVDRPGGTKSVRRRLWHFMERRRLPRERGDPEGRPVWDFTITKRLDLTSGSSLGFRLRPHSRRDPKHRHERQTGNQKKRASRDD